MTTRNYQTTELPTPDFPGQIYRLTREAMPPVLIGENPHRKVQEIYQAKNENGQLIWRFQSRRGLD